MRRVFALKRTFLLVALFVLSFGIFAKPQVMPDWVQNYRKVYPNSEYLAQRGSGDSAEKAKTDAIGALSRYFQSSVNASLSTTLSSVTTNDSIYEKTVVVDEVNVQSQVEFFGLEYTEPFYVKSEKKWYCVVYMNRDEAWQQYKPQIDIKKNSFSGLYKNLEKETDYFTKLGMCKKVWTVGTELLQKLEYGRIINPSEEAQYQKERDEIAEIPVIFETAKQNCSVYININSDYNKMISTAVSTVLTDTGFTVAKTKAEANYVAEINVDDNETGADPVSIKPSVNIKISSKKAKTVFSYEVTSDEKSIGYTIESAQKKSYPKLTEQIKNALNEKFSGSFSL